MKSDVVLEAAAISNSTVAGRSAEVAPSSVGFTVNLPLMPVLLGQRSLTFRSTDLFRRRQTGKLVVRSSRHSASTISGPRAHPSRFFRSASTRPVFASTTSRTLAFLKIAAWCTSNVISFRKSSGSPSGTMGAGLDGPDGGWV